MGQYGGHIPGKPVAWQRWSTDVHALQQSPSVFPSEHFLRTRTQVRDKCTQVHDQNRSSKFAKSVLFRADKPFLSEKNRSKSEFTVVCLVANRRASIDRNLAYEVEMLAFEHSVGYELRGKLCIGVPLRFLSRTAQPHATCH